MLEIVLGHLQDVAGVGQENVAPFSVFGHELILALLESLQFGGIVAFYPAGFVQRYRFPAAFGVIFVLQTVLYDLELKLTDGTDDLATVELVDEQLCHTLVHQLFDGQRFLYI